MIRTMIHIWLVVIHLALLTQTRCLAQETNGHQPGKEIEQLKQKVAELEQALAELEKHQHAAQADTSENELEKELTAELGVTGQQTTQKAGPASGGVSQETMRARGRFFQNMNPNVSVIGTILGNATSLDGVERNVDLSFEEGEFSFQAAVDPYAKADFFIAFGKHAEPVVRPQTDGELEEEAGGLEPEIEEAFITILSLPFSTQLKAGKFRSKFGKINETHPHAYNFVDLPLMYANFFGAEGLNDEGVGLSWLLPNEAFFQELTLQVTSGPSENSSFMRARNNELLYLAHLKNFFDLNDDTTLELGLTGLTGPNNEAGATTQMLAADLTLKWKPLQRNRYQSLEVLNEFLVSKRNGAPGEVTSIAFYSNLRYQFAKRWFIGGLFDYSEFPEFSEFNHKAISGILQFFSTEFQKVEFQYKYNDGNFFDSFSEFKVRAVFVIGAHGAHQY
ncbi:MAG: hypothetical protein ACE5IY_18970 [bacterium]